MKGVADRGLERSTFSEVSHRSNRSRMAEYGKNVAGMDVPEEVVTRLKGVPTQISDRKV